mmetsp:Transcript_114694/g.320510  ORF Transcript_114694/g.320510 Transcript_114694/m.320510 type:complete len:194 (-) Transcript_114694:152-733(-)
MVRVAPALLAAWALGTAGASASTPSACGPDQPSKVPDCDRNDMGSCGNACCALEMSFDMEPEAVYRAIREQLESGVDGSYSYVSGGNPNPADDLRPYRIVKPRKFEFILQGAHSTPLYRAENSDILDFNVASNDAGGSILRMFSLSRIHGALGDAGQNFKTLVYLKKQWSLPDAKMTIVHGCGAPEPTQRLMV